MSIIETRDPLFRPAAAKAVDLLHVFTEALTEGAQQNAHDRDLQGRMIHLAADAYALSLSGLFLTGARNVHAPPQAADLLPHLDDVCEELSRHSSALDSFEVSRFVVQFNSIVGELKNLGFLD